MRGFREWLVLAANHMLALLVVAVPMAAFLVAGSTYNFRFNAINYDPGFNMAAGLVAALVAFLATLPVAAFLAVFLDMREQLVALNGGVRHLRDRPAPGEVAPTPPQRGMRDARGLTDLSRY